MYKVTERLNEALREETQALQEAEDVLEGQMQDMGRRLDEVRRRQGLVAALLGKEEKEEDSNGGVEKQPRLSASAQSVADIAYDILLARGKKPMHYVELAEHVKAAGGLLAGETPGQTLIARIARDPRFVRPERRGWYAARDFYRRARSVGARKQQPSVKTKRVGKSRAH